MDLQPACVTSVCETAGKGLLCTDRQVLLAVVSGLAGCRMQCALHGNRRCVDMVCVPLLVDSRSPDVYSVLPCCRCGRRCWRLWLA
jgi:hypothetical protein